VARLLRIDCHKVDDEDLHAGHRSDLNVAEALREVAGLIDDGETPQVLCDIFRERITNDATLSQDEKRAQLAEMYRDYGVRPPRFVDWNIEK
jgi:hypothetical protein